MPRCLFGTWTGTQETITNHVNHQPVPFTGPGPTETFQPDGTTVSDYGYGTVLTAYVDGHKWTEIIRGTVTLDYLTLDGQLLGSNGSAQGRWTLLDNGSYDTSGPIGVGGGPEQYTCSGNSLRETFPGGSIELTRRAL